MWRNKILSQKKKNKFIYQIIFVQEKEDGSQTITKLSLWQRFEWQEECTIFLLKLYVLVKLPYLYLICDIGKFDRNKNNKGDQVMEIDGVWLMARIFNS